MVLLSHWSSESFKTAHVHHGTCNPVMTPCQCIFCDVQLSIYREGNITYWDYNNWGVCKTCHAKRKIDTIQPEHLFVNGTQSQVI